MRTNHDPEENDPILEAVLRDDEMQAGMASAKDEALRAFRGHHRNRQLVRRAISLAALAVAVGVATHWMRIHQTPTTAERSMPVRAEKQLLKGAPETQGPTESKQGLTDEELVAAFPRGSCFVAEVDGKKRLIFFDPAVEHAYVAR